MAIDGKPPAVPTLDRSPQASVPRTHACTHCNGPLPAAARADAKFCSSPCRQASYRARNGAKSRQRTWTLLELLHLAVADPHGDHPNAAALRRSGRSGRLPLVLGGSLTCDPGTGWWAWVPPEWSDQGELVGYLVRPEGCICPEDQTARIYHAHSVRDCPANPYGPPR